MSTQPNQGEKKPLDMKQVNRILKTPSESRTLKQCTELLEIIGDLQFFKEYNANPSTTNVPKLCCKYMEIEKFEENEIIFVFGLVGVFIKKPPAMLEKQQQEKQQQQQEKKKDVLEVVDVLADFMNVKELGDGSAFGELALLNNKPRLATIKCLKEVYVATLSKDNFNKILKEHEEQKLNKEIQFFEQVHTFKDFNSKQIRFICLNNKTLEVRKGDVIFDEKDPADSLYVIKEGEFEIYKSVEKLVDQKEEMMKLNMLSMSMLNKNHNHKVSKQIKIKVVSVGESIGEEFFLKKKQREFKLVCSSQTGVIVKIKSSDFLRKISEDPSVYQSSLDKFQRTYKENEERVQKKIDQFHEFKNFLVEDRIPTKIKMSIDKMYQNSSLTPKQKLDGISEFRQQIIQLDQQQKINEHQQVILSKTALSQRFSQANSMMFSNQIQYLKYKRLSILSESQTPTARISSPTSITSNRTTVNNAQKDEKYNSFTAAASNFLQYTQKKDNTTKDNTLSQFPYNQLKSHISLNEVNQSDNNNHGEANEEYTFSNYKTPLNKLNADKSNKEARRRQFLKNSLLSSDNLLATINLTNTNNSSSTQSNVYQLAPLIQLKTQSVKPLREEKKQSDRSSSPNTFSTQHRNSLSQYSQSNSSHTLNKRIPSNNDYENSPKVGLTKNRSALFCNQLPSNSQKQKIEGIIPYQQHQETDLQSPNTDNLLYKFNVSKNRFIKYSNHIQKDNFIRDWRKNSNQEYEDAQQQNLARKIKKITSQNIKFSDFFKSQQFNQTSNEQQGAIKLNNSRTYSQTLYPTQNLSKSESVSLNGTPIPLILPKIYDVAQNTSFNGINENTSIISSNEAISPSKEKRHSPPKSSPLQIKSIFQNKEIKEKKKLIIVK